MRSGRWSHLVDDNAQLVIDESLYLESVKTIAEIEDREEKFEMLPVCNAVPPIDHVNDSAYLATHYKYVIGDDLDREVKESIVTYVAAIYLVEHHHASLSDIAEMEVEYTDDTLGFIRSAGWAFLNAWVHRYGGMYQQRVVDRRGTFIDPSVS